MTAVNTDIYTTVSTEISRFMMGERDLSEWDQYVADIEAMGLDELTKFYEAAYDRYEHR